MPPGGKVVMFKSLNSRSVIGKLFSTSGRASPNEFWQLVIYSVMVLLLALALLVLLLWLLKDGTTAFFWASVTAFGIFPVLFAIIMTATAIRRFHDFGRLGKTPVLLIWSPFLLPGGVIGLLALSFAIGVQEPGTSDDGTRIGSAFLSVYLYVFLLPICGLILLLLCSTSSQPGPNKYGPNPNEVEA